MKLHFIIFLAGVFLTHSARGKPQGSQPLVARGSNVYGAGGSFNPGPFPAAPQNQPSPAFRQERLEQPGLRQAPLPAPVGLAPAPVVAPVPVQPPQQVSDDGISAALLPTPGQPTPLEEIDLRVTDLTTGGRPPVGTNDIGTGPTAAFRPQRPQVVGSSGAPRLPSLDNVFGGVPPALESPAGGELGVGVLNRNAETVVGFERNSAQAGGEEEAVPLPLSPGYDTGSQQRQQQRQQQLQQQQPPQQQQQQQQPSVVARGGDTYGAGQSREVPRPAVSGDLDIQPEQPRTKESVLSQAALPDDEPPSQPTAGVRALPPPSNDGEGHHMGGIEWLPESIPGQPLIDYPVLVRIPDSGFDCANQEYDGFFADTSEEARCQAFWVCHNKQQDGFLCPNGTMFNQRYFTCDWWFNVRCEESPDYYELNKNIGVVGTRIDTLPAGVVAAESKVHPVFTLLSEMLHYPRVPPVPPHNIPRKNSSRPSRPPQPAEDYKTSVKIMEKLQDRQTSRLQLGGLSDSKLVRASSPWSVGMLPQFNMKSHKRAVSEHSGTAQGRGARSLRHRRHHKRSRRHKSREAPDPPAAVQNPPNSQNPPQSAQQGQVKDQSSQSGTPEPYIETIQKIDLPMTASGTPKLTDDVTVMEKQGNVTLSQSDKQIPLNLAPISGVPAAAPPAAGQPAANQPSPVPAPGQPPQAPGQYPPQGYPPPPPPQGQPGQPGAPDAPPSGSPPAPSQGQPQSWQPPAGQTWQQNPAQSPVQPQDQPPPPPPPPQVTSQSAAGPAQKQAAPDDGVVIDEDVKVEDGDSSPPVEKKLHFPPDSSTAQTGGQNQPSSVSGAKSNNGTDGNGVSIDEDIKVDENESGHPVEEELRYPPGGKPTLIEGSGHDTSSHPGTTSSPNSSQNPANVRDPSALHHDMPSENASPDDMAKTKAPPTNGKDQTEDKIQITSETVSKVVQNPKPQPIRDPSGLQPPKSDSPPSMPQKKSDQKRENSRSKKRAKDFPRDVSGSATTGGKHYPEVRIIGNFEPLPKAGLASEVSRTVNAVDKTLSLDPNSSGQSRTFDAGTFYLSPQSKNSFHDGTSQISPTNPVGVNLKIFVDQTPISKVNQGSPGYPGAGSYSAANYPAASYPLGSYPVQYPAPAKSRRMVEPEEPASVADAYDYDVNDLPSWMQKKVAAVKRSVASYQLSADGSPHELLDQAAVSENGENYVPLQTASRQVRKAVHVPDSQSNDVKRALAAPRVQKIFQSAREQLMKLLGGPRESLDSEIDTLLGKAQSDKDKRENDMKLRLDSSSLTSYPELGLDPL